MSDNGITIEADAAILSHKRTADQGLMNGFARANVSKAHLRKLNLCRLYLQITHLSDISTGDGFRINAQFTGTDREPPFREATRNQFVWPRQPCPPLPFWKLWRHYISTTFTNYGTRLGQARPLKEEEYRSNWDWFVDMEEVELWKLTGDQWSRHAWINPRRLHERYNSVLFHHRTKAHPL